VLGAADVLPLSIPAAMGVKTDGETIGIKVLVVCMFVLSYTFDKRVLYLHSQVVRPFQAIASYHPQLTGFLVTLFLHHLPGVLFNPLIELEVVIKPAAFEEVLDVFITAVLEVRSFILQPAVGLLHGKHGRDESSAWPHDRRKAQSAAVIIR